MVTTDPHFLWVTEFPLFTRDDADKEHLSHGRWSSSHHPFTAPMWEDIDALNRGEVEGVSSRKLVNLTDKLNHLECYHF